MSRLFIVRHGETDYNREGRYQGSVDLGLNETGRSQALGAAEYLHTQGITHLFSSPLRRARETALIIADRLQLKVEYIAGFAERNLGLFQGQTREEIEAQFPGIWSGRPTGQMYTAPDGAESLVELSLRVARAYASLQLEYAGTRAVLVCHSGVARTLNGLLRRVDDEAYFNYRLANGEMDSYPW